MKRVISLWTVLLVLGLAASALAQGVQTGNMRGSVEDDQGAKIPGATVTITSPSMQGPRTTVTDVAGSYVFRSIPAGVYDVKFELSGFKAVTAKTTVPLGGEAERNARLQVGGVEEVVEVVADEPAPIQTPTGGQNFKKEDIDNLATSRTVFGIATLAPSVTTNAPNSQQISISGAFGFDNVFMVNGVDVNDNLYGSPQDLFIEDAIQETQVLTRGISAEYGRFTGGVVNAITKSGGNKFSGSFRVNFQNETWTKQTPFELCDPAVTATSCTPSGARPSDLQEIYEGTLGGPIVKDKLWFFGAGRYRQTSDSSSLPITNLPNTAVTTNKRGEIKITGTVKSNHTLTFDYLNDPSNVTSSPVFPFTIDKFGVNDPSYPNWSTVANYRGVYGNKLLAEVQYSARKFQFKDAGGTATNILESPFITLTQELGHYNAPYFDSTDPEDRNGFQVTGNLTYFLDTGKRGRHEIKGGYEFFRSQNTGGNSQSATNYVFDADYATDANGNPTYDASGHLIPEFVPSNTLLENWLPVRGAVLNVDNNSIYVQDHWAVNSHLSADVGFRYERVRSEATGGIVGVDTDTFVPRLGVSYDLQGNGRNVIHAFYGHYSGRYNEAQIGVNSNVGNPNETVGVYVGPQGAGRDFAPGFDPNNYFTVFGSFPTANVFFEPGLSSPIVKEFTTSYGTSFHRGYAEAAYVWRRWNNFIEDFIDLSNGFTNVVQDGVDAGTFTNRVYRNTNIAERRYQALEFQSRYSLSGKLSVNGSYTLQLENDGNYVGEATNQPAVPSVIGDYPEILDPARHYPDGRLPGFQRHKLVMWTVYNVGLHRAGDVSLSGLWRVNSGTTYSLRALGQPLTDAQCAIVTCDPSAPGLYPDAPSSQNIFYGALGSQSFLGYGVLDFDVNYNVPVFRSLRPWVKFDVYNLLNNQKLISWNTTVNPDPNSPTDALGLSTGYIQGSRYGKATSNSNFPVPFLGFSNTGGRTMRVAVGFRF